MLTAGVAEFVEQTVLHRIRHLLARQPAQQPSRASDDLQRLCACRALKHVSREGLPPQQRQAPIDVVIK